MLTLVLINIYIYIYMYVCVCMYIYIYIITLRKYPSKFFNQKRVVCTIECFSQDGNHMIFFSLALLIRGILLILFVF